MRIGKSVVGALLASLVVLGCGGGGGGSKGATSRGAGTLAVLVNGVPGSDAGPAGTVHTLAVYRSDGTKVDKQTVNLSTGTKVVQFTGLPSGTLHLHIGISDSEGGPELGAVDKTFDGSVASDPIQVWMRKAVTGVQVTPSTLTVATGASVPAYAAARAADNGYVYTSPGGWAWSTPDPNTATVDGNGSVTGVAVGNTTVTAKHLASGVSGSGTLGVFSDAITHGKWTILVYMDAANDLFTYATKNLNQMEAIANNPNVRFVVQWKQVQGLLGNDAPLFTGTRRYLAAYDPTNVNDFNNEIKSTLVQDLGTGVDMASPLELRKFVDWAKAKYPADHYALVLWSHGGGWFSTKSFQKLKSRAIIFDEETNNELSLPDVRGALNDNALDILAYDACLMQSTESLMEFSGKARYVVGSEDNVPVNGLPYHIVFKPFVETPDADERTLAGNIVNQYVNTYKNANAGFPIQMSVLDTSQAGNVAVALDDLGSALLAGGTNTGLQTRAVRSATERIEPTSGYFYYDLSQLTDNLVARPALGANVQSAATALKAALSGAIVANAGDSDAANFKGLSIEFATSGTFNGYVNGYRKLRLSDLTHWDEFLASTAANP